MFYDEGNKSAHLSVTNSGTKSQEVWIDFKYGYTIVDDSGKPAVIVPDNLGPDDPSAAGWIRSFPPRFIIGAGESQVVRLVVTPPPGIPVGEYWARVLISSKDLNTAFAKGKAGVGTSFQMIVAKSIPFHYRTRACVTGLRLTKPIEYKDSASVLIVTVPLKREGNASYWGELFARVLNSTGKPAASQDFKLAVYKEIAYVIRIDKTTIPPGDYTLELTAKTVRPEVKNSVLTKAVPVSWSSPVTIR